MSPADAELLRHASALHDVGKVGIPDEILSKPGPLDADEWETMKTHTTIGASILAGLGLARSSSSPRRSRSPTTSTGTAAATRSACAARRSRSPGRICAICDVFDALLSARPYKDPWPFDRAIAEIELLSGSQFDPQLVRAFLAIAPEPARRVVRADRRGPAPAEPLELGAP